MMLIRALRREVSNYILQTLDYIGVEHGIDDDGNGDDGDDCDYGDIGGGGDMIMMGGAELQFADWYRLAVW